MTRAWWPLGCAAAFLLCASVGTADAQTFVVRNAPAGSAVEVTFGTAVGKGTADRGRRRHHRADRFAGRHRRSWRRPFTPIPATPRSA